MKHYFIANILQPYEYSTSKSFSIMRKKNAYPTTVGENDKK